LTRVKICGVNSLAALLAAAGASADYVGFVFFAKSPRHLSFDAAAALSQSGGPRRIGLIVDAGDDFIMQAVRAGRLDGVQLHGSETPERVAAVKQLTRLEVWKAVGVAARADIVAARRFAGVADRILYDAKPAAGAVLPGGTGVRFDWRLLDGVDPGAPWGLAGGLDASTVADAIAIAHPPLVDVSSGVEDAPGVKSPAKIRAFIKTVRAA
jgi:phosphoribosylanthranilate isomerase